MNTQYKNANVDIKNTKGIKEQSFYLSLKLNCYQHKKDCYFIHIYIFHIEMIFYVSLTSHKHKLKNLHNFAQANIYKTKDKEKEIKAHCYGK